jgi:hypothetical protein
MHNSLLCAKGFIICEVGKVSLRLAGAIITKRCLDLLGTVFRKPHSMQINVPESIWRTLCADRDDTADLAPRAYRDAMLDLLQLHLGNSVANSSTNLLEDMSSIDTEELLETDLSEHVRKYLTVVRDVIWNRRTFRSSINNDMVGLVPQNARADDFICVLHGCSVPVVLREHKESGEKAYWQLVGDVYVHERMNGEILISNGWEMEFEIR